MKIFDSKKYFNNYRKKLIRECDKLFSDYIKKRDNYTCQKCGSNTKQLNCAHFYSRSIKSLRWNELNAITLCVGCHFWGHKNPSEFSTWYIERILDENFNKLQMIKNNRFKTSIQNLEILKIDLQGKL